jgi:predicted cation transporter
MTYLMLALLLFLILLLPFFVRTVEREIEYFLFLAGAMAVTISGGWTARVMTEAATEPLKITAAVLIAGLAFEFYSGKIRAFVGNMCGKTGTAVFVFILVVVIGVLSSVITAIIAALILSEVITHMKLPRDKEVKIVVLACFSIGLGSVLTPVGGPLSAIVISKLKGIPYNAGFFYTFRMLWPYTIPCILVLGILSAFITGVPERSVAGLKEDRKEDIKSVFVRSFKVYIFVAGLVLLGSGFGPLVEAYVIRMPHYLIYWINSVSAVVDNAALAAAEISPSMSVLQIRSAVLGLIISGGMLIPGNIPNIICANKLGIKSGEWAKFGLPLGAALMIIYFAVILASVS